MPVYHSISAKQPGGASWRWRPWRPAIELRDIVGSPNDVSNMSGRMTQMPTRRAGLEIRGVVPAKFSSDGDPGSRAGDNRPKAP
jgi:hypothetical protein